MKCKRIKKEYEGNGGVLVIRKKKKNKAHEGMQPISKGQLLGPVLGPNGSANMVRGNQRPSYGNPQRLAHPFSAQRSVDEDIQGIQALADDTKLMPSRYSNTGSTRPSEVTS